MVKWKGRSGYLAYRKGRTKFETDRNRMKIAVHSLIRAHWLMPLGVLCGVYVNVLPVSKLA